MDLTYLCMYKCIQSATGWSPVYVDDNLGVMSIGFMLPNQDDAIIWRGPRKNGVWCASACVCSVFVFG